MSDVILTINAGSSSIKFAAYASADAGVQSLASGHIEGIGDACAFVARTADGRSFDYPLAGRGDPVTHRAALGAAVEWLLTEGRGGRIVAVGHRIVHGGPHFSAPALIDRSTLDDLRRLSPLAPLHQLHNIAGVEAALAAFPYATQVACFDTAFHRSHPFVADTFALPRGYYDEGVRRYGFHGLSYEFVSRRLREIAPVVACGRVIIAHLGNGASACALRDGHSVASTMGFTALDGLAMGTRCGQLDPGVVLYLLTEKGMSPDAITDLLYKQSGLKGMSGLSNDMRDLEASDAPEARTAIDYFVSRVRREIGGLAVVLNGLDAIVFTGGIGEHAWRVREAILADMDWLGVTPDREANARNAEIISTPRSAISVFVLATDEERMIAEHTLDIAGLSPARGSHPDAIESVPAPAQ